MAIIEDEEIREPGSPPSREPGQPDPAVDGAQRKGLGKLALGFVAFLAAMGTTACSHPWSCCEPARPDRRCRNVYPSGTGFRCPSGYYKRGWYCCDGSAIWACWECTPASSCWVGPFACSDWNWTQGC